MWGLLFLWKIYSRFCKRSKSKDDKEIPDDDGETEKKDVVEPLQNGYSDDPKKSGDPLAKVNFVPSNSVQTTETDIC